MSSNIIIGTIVSLVFLAGIFFLQAFLSKRDVSWAGWILPLLTFVTSVAAFFSGIEPNGFKSAIGLFGMTNIGTLIFIAIYFGCRNRQILNAQIEKMQKQDLQ